DKEGVGEQPDAGGLPQGVAQVVADAAVAGEDGDLGLARLPRLGQLPGNVGLDGVGGDEEDDAGLVLAGEFEEAVAGGVGNLVAAQDEGAVDALGPQPFLGRGLVLGPRRRDGEQDEQAADEQESGQPARSHDESLGVPQPAAPGWPYSGAAISTGT